MLYSKELMEANYLTRHPRIKDAFQFGIFILLVAIGTILINAFVFRSFSVLGPSMESTMYTGDRLIVNRIPVTMAQLKNQPYTPERGQIIVFKNPRYVAGEPDEYIVKRVIAFAGERVTVKDGVVTVYNAAHTDGFRPDDATKGPGSPTSGEVDMTVPDGTLFVCGDHRQGNYSYDSRSGLGTIPLFDVIGPVSARIWPLTSITFY
ncbi:signal peptidase I [Candidatus Saccharimonas aalborgensis]|jgi:signal peptidase I|uniref:Signal peptidase I n=1 Tax=Candidatus Saccharimonas aalborgensis TaxID=1332188 RepID=R4PXE3_9BACT|nr:signal peptidase I [Candidatus Saccharimonas aalborgensis]AGL62437.1 signal peptidase I [Candidatus Saccharimonas aalborgensis]